MTCRIFCAIDANNHDDALAMVNRLGGLPIGIKLGLEFFVAEGPRGVEKIRAATGGDKEIFLDLKLHDIPNTVAGAVRAAIRCRPDFITVHTSGGKDMMVAAVIAAKEASEKEGVATPKILGVTVLTHLDGMDLDSVGQGYSLEEQVKRLALLAESAGLQGLVCAPQEIRLLRQTLKQPMLLVVPGIRPDGSAAGDQKRTMTPAEAARLGADYLVIGRPITQAADPAQAAKNILNSIRLNAA
ncbi:MAG: orotidine-5'-phosphate decarboxylase [Alphaproteobacteria bacterium]|nr:MAG: orotidine-5'-phosphate decarboxylase [Alphaproteobacteria bacterium]